MSSFEDNIMTSLYLTLSNESRKMLNDNQEYDYNQFHNLIGFNPESLNNNIISNETVMHLCNNFMTIDNSK
jgi:hypothetical protein